VKQTSTIVPLTHAKTIPPVEIWSTIMSASVYRDLAEKIVKKILMIVSTLHVFMGSAQISSTALSALVMMDGLAKCAIPT